VGWRKVKRLMKVWQIIETALTPSQRAVMMAVKVQEVALDVIAERLDSNRNAIYKLLHDARVKLNNV